jgi:hypothetical protein
MESLLEKLNYKGQRRIAVINADKDFSLVAPGELEGVQVDNEIDQRFPYDYMIIFVRQIKEVEKLAPVALHNLVADGILWFCYPKKSSKKFSSDVDRDHGWNALTDEGFYGIRLVSVDEDWSALRFRNRKFIKSGSDRFGKKRS